jgi:hypothetical protein
MILRSLPITDLPPPEATVRDCAPLLRLTWLGIGCVGVGSTEEVRVNIMGPVRLESRSRREFARDGRIMFDRRIC